MPNPWEMDWTSAAPSNGPVYGPPPKAPAAPSPYQMQRDSVADQYRAEDQQMQRQRFEFDMQEAQRKAAEEAKKGGGKALPDSAAKRIESGVGTYTSLKGALDGFQDGYGGNPITGGLENTIQGMNSGFGTPGQRDWWANFRAADNQVRNELFGSALTATEQAAWTATTVSERMDPKEIRKNLQTRTGILEKALDRQRRFMIANGYNSEAVGILYEPIMAMEALKAEADKATGEDATPPALGAVNEYDPTNPNQTPIPGAGLDNGGDGGTQIAEGADKRVDNPALAGVRDEYIRRLARGDSAGQLVQWARTAGISPSAFGSIAQQVQFRKANPNVPIEQYDTSQLDDMSAPFSLQDRAVNAAAQSSLGAGVIGLADGMTAGNLDSIVGATGGNAERARLGMGQIAQQRPLETIGGNIVGGTLSALALEGGAGAAGLTGASRALVADGIYGAAAGAGGTDYAADGSEATLADRAGGAVKGMLAGLIGNRVASGITRGASGVSNPTVNAVRNEGIPMTLGQLVGQSGRVGAAIKGIEDRVAGLSVVGDVINARRAEGVQAFNTKAFDKALEPIGGKVAGKTGAEAVETAHQQVQDAFATALGGKAVSADRKFANDLTNASTRTMSIGKVGPDVAENVRAILEPHMTGAQFTGEAMQIISRELRELKAAYRTKEPAYSKRIGDAIDATEEAVFGMFRRQAPEVLPAYNAAKKAYRRVSIMADAVNAADNQTDGLFTPAQLNRADKANAKKYEGSISAAAGPRQFREYATAANAVLPNKVPDSGTAGRLVLPAVAGGMLGADAYAGDGVNPGTLALATVLAGAYTKAGQRVLTKGAVKNETARKLITAGTASTAASLSTQ